MSAVASSDWGKLVADHFVAVDDAVYAHAKLYARVVGDDFIAVLVDFAFVATDA